MIHLPNTPKVLNQFPNSAGKPFQPSNGTEGMIFTEAFCECCIYEHPHPEMKPKCDILSGSMIEGQQPEWQYSPEGWPICTKWKHWDWGNDDDGWNEPPEPEPDDPDQLVIPFDLIEIMGAEWYKGLSVTRIAIFESQL